MLVYSGILSYPSVTEINFMQDYIEDQIFDKLDFSQTPFSNGQYDHCTFLNCNFSNVDLSGNTFTDCDFIGCNLSLAKLNKTAFRDVTFKDCKMLGLHFENCNDFGFSITTNHCILSHSTFYRVKLKKTSFSNTKLDEVDFTECDLSAATFDYCDLNLATFQNTILEKADFRTAYNYSIDPEENRIKKAKFSQSGISGLLNKYDIIITV